MATKISIDAGPRDEFAQNIWPFVEAVITEAIEICAKLAEKRAEIYDRTSHAHASPLRRFADELRETRREYVASK